MSEITIPGRNNLITTVGSARHKKAHIYIQKSAVINELITSESKSVLLKEDFQHVSFFSL
jgi:hypothetical protein